MADIRCPMCGKPNPADRDTCQFCEARLKPLIAKQDNTEDLFGTSSQDEEVPEWLRSLRGEQAGGTGGEAEEAPMDWLQEQAPEEQASEESPAGEEPDWLQRVGGETQAQPAETTPEFTPGEEPQAAEEFHEWAPTEAGEVAGGESASLFAAGEEEPGPIPFEEGEGGKPEWLADLEAGAGAPEPGQEEPLPDWLTPSQEAPAPDWLSGVSGEEGISLEETAIPAEGESAGQPAIPAGEGEKPDWLSSLEGQGEPAWEGGEEQPPAIPGEEAEPDWLAELEASSKAAQSPEAGEETDWLSRVRARQKADFEVTGEEAAFAAEPPAGEPEAASGAEVPDWLSGLISEEPLPLEAAETPDWLKGDQTVVPPFIAQPEEAGGLPNWLKGEASLEPAEAPPVPAEEAIEAAPSEAEGTPEWLKELTGLSTPPGEEEAIPMQTAGFEGEPEPEWLSKLDLSGTQPLAGSGVPAFIMDEEPAPFAPEEALEPAAAEEGLPSVPEWPSEVAAEEEGLPSAEEEGELEPAKLPGWLEAMRPVEATLEAPFKDTSDARLESAGPLAGLMGALPPGLDLSQMRKPPVYTVKLQVPEEQQARMDLLKELVDGESQPQPLPKPAILSTQYILRLIIFGLFLLAAIWAMWAGGRQTPLPASGGVPQEVVELYQQIAALPTGASVLLAVDYEPGFSAELEPAASAVLKHLADRGAFVMVVSTSPDGPPLAERLFQKLNALPERSQNPFTSYANLGYIAGGPAGLLAFSRSPQQLMTFDLNGAYPWKGPQAGLDSFQMVLVITERAETARTWIEQVGPQLRKAGVPLAMLVSAQVEPLVRPYYDAYPKQVAGLVAGLMGGIFYESLAGQPGSGRAVLDAYSLTTLMAVALILVGGLISFFTTTLAQTRPGKGEGKA